MASAVAISPTARRANLWESNGFSVDVIWILVIVRILSVVGHPVKHAAAGPVCWDSSLRFGLRS